MVLINSLTPSFARAFISTSSPEYLYNQHFIPININDDFGVPVLKQNFREYKIFFKELKKNCLPTEFIFALNIIKSRILELDDIIHNYIGRDEYWIENPFDYNIVIKFIERYVNLFEHSNRELLYQYELDLQIELFYRNFNTEERFNRIKKNLETIYFSEKYGKPNVRFIFGGTEFGVIYGIKQSDAKTFFESEILKDEYLTPKNKHQNPKEYFIDSSENSIFWNGKQTEFIELIKALIENGSIKGDSQKKIIELVSKFLNIEIKYPDKLITDIKNRNNGSETIFLDKLKTSLYDYIQK